MAKDFLDQTPPQDIEAEQAVLGAMCLDSLCIPDVLGVIGPQEGAMFFRAGHREIFEVILALHDAGKPIDLLIVRDALKQRGNLHEVGGEDYLVQLGESVPSTANARYYAEVVREKAWLRTLARAGADIARSAYRANGKAQEVLDEAATTILDITTRKRREEPAAFADFLDDAFAAMTDRDGPGITGLSTSLLALDDRLCGLQNGELIVVAARPTVGKTSLALQMALNVARVDAKPVVFFSMEMPRQQIALRALCTRARLDSHKLRRGMLDMYEQDALQNVLEETRGLPLFIDDTVNMTPLELRAKARRLWLEKQIGAVFVDYLQLMRHPGAENRQCEIAFISASLKRLARELNIPVVACAQLNRQPEARKDKRPQLSDLRESGAVEQDADTVLLIHRPEVTDPTNPRVAGLVEINIAKQRNGPTGIFEFAFEKRWTRFDDRAGPQTEVTATPAGPETEQPF